MKLYRILFLRGGLLTNSEAFEADSDMKAIKAVAGVTGSDDVEVWRDHRRLAKFRATVTVRGEKPTPRISSA